MKDKRLIGFAVFFLFLALIIWAVLSLTHI
jgi:nitrate reductase NapE component